MAVLKRIIAAKRTELEERKQLCPIKLLERSIYFSTKPVSLRRYLLREDRVGIIAEIKRRSPSRGEINPHISIEELSIGYMQAGASALSVLTDREFFGGSGEDLSVARRFNFCPILRKDFIIDEYQLFEAKSWGADAVLLIAALLEKDDLVRLAKRANDLGLEVLFEVHCERELEKLPSTGVEIVGVNNRDLDSLEVSLDTAHSLREKLPKEVVAVAESGLSTPEDILSLRSSGYRGFLIGEFFMAHPRPQDACREMIVRIQDRL